MSKHEMFVSLVRRAGDLAGFFEYDGEVGYFYLYDQHEKDKKRIKSAIHIFSGKADFVEADVDVRWSADQAMVGLFIRGELWAVFGAEGAFGGKYAAGKRSSVPQHIAAVFG